MKQLLIALLALIVTGQAFAEQRILVFSKTLGWRHKAIETAVIALENHAKQHAVTAVSTEDATMFTPETLAQFNAVVFLLTTGDVLDESQQKAFEDYIRQGGGFAGVHSATDTEYDWPWYNKLVGGYFAGHPNDPNVREGRILVVDKHHFATQSLPAIWEREDEWYDFKQRNNDVTVLLDVDETSYKNPAENPTPTPRPISWYHHYDGGRAFYTGLGHTTASYDDPMFMQHLWGGISWTMGDKSP